MLTLVIHIFYAALCNLYELVCAGMSMESLRRSWERYLFAETKARLVMVPFQLQFVTISSCSLIRCKTVTEMSLLHILSESSTLLAHLGKRSAVLWHCLIWYETMCWCTKIILLISHPHAPNKKYLWSLHLPPWCKTSCAFSSLEKCDNPILHKNNTRTIQFRTIRKCKQEWKITILLWQNREHLSKNTLPFDQARFYDNKPSNFKAVEFLRNFPRKVFALWMRCFACLGQFAHAIAHLILRRLVCFIVFYFIFMFYYFIGVDSNKSKSK